MEVDKVADKLADKVAGMVADMGPTKIYWLTRSLTLWPIKW